MVKISLILAALFSWLCLSHAGEIEAQLDRNTVQAGNGALLTIRVSGMQIAPPELPQVENLIFNARGQSKQIQMVNGTTSVAITFTYAVGSNVIGDYEIPSIPVNVGGEILTTQPFKLRVTAAAAPPPPAPAPPSNPTTPPTTADTVEDEAKRFGFLTVELVASDRQHVYVGEIAPVRIRAWLPANSQASLRSGIQPEGKAFTLHNVSDQPQQSQEMRDGKRYTVITWFGGMSATKSGKYPASLSVNATVAVRDPNAPKPQRRRNMGGPFDDPFFDSVFEDMNVQMIQKDVTLKSDDQQIEVLPLPTEGRPADFAGAVGAFKFDGTEIPSTWKTGEPQQIAARITGSGNFSLMRAPSLTPPDRWKTYSGKDRFEGGDQASFSGNKIFQFNALPRKGGDQELALSFSYFDPATGKYETATSPPQKIQVTGADVVEEEKPVETPAEKPPEKPQPRLAAQRLTPGRSGSLLPLVSQPIFPQLLAGSAGLAALGGLLAAVRRRRENPARLAHAATEKATQAALALAEKSAAAGDVHAYFAAARLALQHRLSAQWNQPAQAITLSEVEARLAPDSPVTAFFREADRHEYSRQPGREISLEWRALFATALTALTS